MKIKIFQIDLTKSYRFQIQITNQQSTPQTWPHQKCTVKPWSRTCWLSSKTNFRIKFQPNWKKVNKRQGLKFHFKIFTMEWTAPIKIQRKFWRKLNFQTLVIIPLIKSLKSNPCKPEILALSPPNLLLTRQTAIISLSMLAFTKQIKNSKMIWAQIKTSIWTRVP